MTLNSLQLIKTDQQIIREITKKDLNALYSLLSDKDAMLILNDILSKTSAHREKQHAATLNTPKEGTFDERLPLGQLFKNEVFVLKRCLQ